jgi:hypothetical protein
MSSDEEDKFDDTFADVFEEEKGSVKGVTVRTIINPQFWNNHEQWPIDPPNSNYIFLARAVNELGALIFQNSWSKELPSYSPELEVVCQKIVDFCNNNHLTLATRPNEGGPWTSSLNRGAIQSVVFGINVFTPAR